MKFVKKIAFSIFASAAIACSAQASEPENLFFSVAHVKLHEQVSLGIVTVAGGVGSSESYNVRAVPFEVKTGQTTTLSSVKQATGFGVSVVPHEKRNGAAWVIDVTYVVKNAGVIVIKTTKTVQLEHGQSAELPVSDTEKMIVSLK